MNEYIERDRENEPNLTMTAYEDIGCGKQEILLCILHYSGLECNF